MAIIVVTGASQGIGAEVAKAFAREKKHTLLLLARNEANLRHVLQECQELGAVNAEYFISDVTDEASVKKTAKSILAKWGTPDVLVNNAGHYAGGTFLSTTFDEFKSQIDVNLMSAFLVTHAFLGPMLENKSGDIFFICSIASVHAYPGTGYTASKHGLLGLARALREETKKLGLRVTSIMPGAVLTPAWGALDIPADRFIPGSDIGKVIVDIHNLDRSTDIEEIIIRPRMGDV